MRGKTLIATTHNRISDNPVIKGTLILTFTGILTRFIGFYNRIFLNNLIGARELGIYQLIFPLYIVAFSITTTGNELALTKLVSEYRGRNDEKSARAFLSASLLINLTLSTVTSIFFYTNADFLSSKLLNASSCGDCLKTLSIGIPFMAAKGAIHGYFLGMERSEIHGISDFLEQIAKVLGLYLVSTHLTKKAVFTASFAVIGIVMGEVVSFLYSLIALLKYFHDNSPKHTSPSFNLNEQPIHRQKVFSIFLRNSIPLTANRFILTLLQSTEAILIPTFLLKYYHDSALSLSTYGIFSGMAFPFIMFPATITNSLSVMLLPAVSGAHSELKTKYLNRIINKSLCFCLLIGIASAAVFFLSGNMIGNLVFHNKEAGIFLYRLSFLCPLIYLATTLASILNGLGLATHNLMLTVLATGIRLSSILLLVPRYGMSGYILGLFASYIFLTLSSCHKLSHFISHPLYQK